ncbi:MAG: NAD(P)-dependent oxidoreductase [Lachnospira sp.]|nr:NAD(P)-dependent oxidoreductase [Lachnospira sp.]
MFNKIVVIESTGMTEAAYKEMKQYAQEIVRFEDIPGDNAEIIRRIGDADAALLSYTSRIDQEVIDGCPNLKYIGMCCSLYSEESANVDIAYARTKGISVRGIRDYGDQGVVEYVLHELIGLLHGYGSQKWEKEAIELTRLKVGIVGLGTSGTMIAQALHFLGADVRYYSRTRKPEQEKAGISYMELHPLLSECTVICTCLNKNVILLHEEEFEKIGHHKILINTSIAPSHDVPVLAKWLENPENFFFTDTPAGLGGADAVAAVKLKEARDKESACNTSVCGKLLVQENVTCRAISAGRTAQAFELMGRKVLDNIAMEM